jgi:arginyl-tRNA synthetase
MDLKQKIVNILEEITGVKEVNLETPENEEFGDYSTNVALQDKGGIPGKTAKGIVEKLQEDKKLSEIIDKIDIAGPGFINFWLKKDVLIDNLIQISRDKESYGKSDLNKGKKIMVEFAHPNTHKELHIGHMRTLILGEALSRIFEANGAKVFRANYQGDIGPHVAKAIWGTQKILDRRNISWDEAEKLSLAEKAHLLGEGYVLGNQKYETKKSEIDELNTKLYRKDSEIVPVYDRTRRWSLEYYDSFYKRFGTKFDKLYFETEVAEKGKDIVKANIGGVFTVSEGAIIFEGEKYGLHTRVFVTKEDNPTYEAKDMYLAQLQYSDFPFDLNIHVVANEQKGYFEVIFKALELLDEKFKGREFHLPMGMVNLVGRKMSSRTGEIYIVDQLMDDIKSIVLPLVKKGSFTSKEKEDIAEKVTTGAIKYSMLKVTPTADVAFDLKQSVNTEGDSGPYLQYTFARTQSVLHKAQPGKLKSEDSKYDQKMETEELLLLRSFVQFPEVIESAAKNYSPNILCEFLFDLAQKYNTFYNKHKIIGSKREPFRLAITYATGQILRNGLTVLGIQTPERM